MTLAVRGRVLPDAQQQVVADRVQVGRVAGDLQLPAHARARRVGEVERVERIDLAERDHVAGVVDEAHGVDPLAAAQAADGAEPHEPAVAVGERGDQALRVVAESPSCSRRAARRWYSESANWLSSSPGTVPVAL